MERPSASALKITAIVFAILIALRFLWIAHAIFVVAFLGVLLGLPMARAVDWLQRFRIRRGFGAPIVLLAGLGILFAIGAVIGPSIRDQTGELGRELPRALQSIQQRIGIDNAQAATSILGSELRSATKFLFPVVSSVLGAIGGFVIVVFIAMYIAAEPGLYREGVLHLVPHAKRDRAREVLATLRDTLRQWLIARLMAMVLIGIITGSALAAMGVKAAAALGLLAGILEFIPFFGPVISAIPAIVIAFVDSPDKALWVAALYVAMQQLEGNVITPLLLERRLDIPPVLTVVAVASLGMVFGVLGMLIAEPLLAAILVTTKMLYVEGVVGDDVNIGKK